jgi:coenzyme F420-reducing hydrogenase beta subunit
MKNANYTTRKPDMMKNNFIDRLLKRKWTPELIEKYMGKIQSSWLAYSLDEEIRQNAASGGTITTLFSYLLEIGEIDGALVCATRVEGNELVAEYRIAKSREELISSQGSKYIETNFATDAVPLIKEFKGKLALSAIPCDTWIIDKLRKNNPEIDEKIRLVVSVFCGHVSDPGLSRLVIKKYKPAGVSLTSFRHRVGHWRGKTRFDFDDKTRIEKPFSVFSDYQNLYFFCARKCLHCNDHTAYLSDISVGDVWLQSMKENPIKHNAVIVRSKQAETYLLSAREKGKIFLESVSNELIADAQARSLPMHYNVSARTKAGKILGIPVGDPVHERVRINDFLVAFLIMLNYKWTTTASGRLNVGRIPKPILKLYLYALKALEVL